MKVGLSTYSLAKAIRSGEMTLADAVEWIANSGGEHVELAPPDNQLIEQPELVEKLVRTAGEIGIPFSSYCIPASFIDKDEQAWQAEVDRMKRHVDVARRLGVRTFRHDLGNRPTAQTGVEQFERDMPAMVKAAQVIADYAAPMGIISSLENHGLHVQASDRVRRIVHAVNRANYRLTLDAGNFIVVGEHPLAGVRRTADLICMLHLKDFLLLPPGANPGQGWKEGADGGYRRTTIVGQGHLPIKLLLDCVYQSGYDGYVSIEFDGLEECKQASRISMDNVKRMCRELQTRSQL